MPNQSLSAVSTDLGDNLYLQTPSDGSRSAVRRGTFFLCRALQPRNETVGSCLTNVNLQIKRTLVR